MMREQGAALLIVIWVVLLAGIIVLAIGYQLELETVLSQEFRDERQARANAESLFWWAMLRLQNDMDDRDTPGKFQVDGSVWQHDLGPIAGDVRFIDEGSRVNVNTAPETLMKNLFEALGCREFVAPLLDWRDPDNLPRPDGAEEAEYAALSPSVKVRNGSIPVPQELRRIKGGEEAWEKIRDEVTVWGPALFALLDSEVFVNLLRQSGMEFDELTAFELIKRFEQLNKDKQLKTLDDFIKIHPMITMDRVDKLREYITEEGTFNPNFLSEERFRALLKTWQIVIPEEQRTSERVFESREAFEQFIRSMNPEVSSETIWKYFTLQTKLWRIRVTVNQGFRQFVIDAVVRREREGAGQRWKASILRWNERWQVTSKEESDEAEDWTEP